MSFITIGNVTVNTEWVAFLLALLLVVIVEKISEKENVWMV